MTTKLPLPTLLSQVLVAFTIEFDNEFEHQMAHRTTKAGASSGRRGGPWLASQVMWSNVLQYVGDEGIRIGDLHARARTTRDSLAGLQRWGYVVVAPAPVPVQGSSGGRGGPRHVDLVVRPTASGRKAQEVWRPLAGLIEERWQARFTTSAIGGLRDSLQGVVNRLEVDLPDYLPIVHPAMNGKAEIPEVSRRESAGSGRETARSDLSTLLSQVLLAFTIGFEGQSNISLPIGANTLRVLDEAGVRVRDLPRLTGVSKEANSMAVGFLQRHGCVVVEQDPAAPRTKLVLLRPKGQKAQASYRQVLDAVEKQWQVRFGETDIADLRALLTRLVGEGTEGESPLFLGLEPYADGWRASVRRPATLPHYPMVLHRGGYPDGS